MAGTITPPSSLVFPGLTPLSQSGLGNHQSSALPCASLMILEGQLKGVGEGVIVSTRLPAARELIGSQLLSCSCQAPWPADWSLHLWHPSSASVSCFSPTLEYRLCSGRVQGPLSVHTEHPSLVPPNPFISGLSDNTLCDHFLSPDGFLFRLPTPTLMLWQSPGHTWVLKTNGRPSLGWETAW